jgi:hypothetical protein
MPGRVIDVQMNMADARRYRERASAENGDNPDILGPVLDEDQTALQRLGQRRVDDKPRRRFVLDRYERRRPYDGSRALRIDARNRCGGYNHRNPPSPMALHQNSPDQLVITEAKVASSLVAR